MSRKEEHQIRVETNRPALSAGSTDDKSGDQPEKSAPEADLPEETQEQAAEEQGAEQPDVQALQAEVENLRQQVEELKDKYLRALAEMENLRRRTREEQARLIEHANERLLAELLAVVDDLERALANADTSAQALRKGVELIHQKLLSIMRDFGAEPLEAVGQQFDPYLHEAVERVETEEVPENTIVAELQRGYKYRDKLLRPARVKVAARPESEQENE